MSLPLSQKHKDELDSKGYTVIENVLNEEQLATITEKCQQLIDADPLRSSDVRVSPRRKRLLSDNGLASRISLALDDILFRVLRKIISVLRHRIPRFGESMYHYSIRPSLYRNRKDTWKEEVGTMLLNISQQAEVGVDRVCNLINKGSEFDICLTDSRIIEAIDHIMGKNQYVLSSINYRAPQKAHGAQQLHADYLWPVEPGQHFAANTLWLLDDMTENNGPTRFIPGTHKSGKLPAQEVDVMTPRLPNEERVIAPAGSVIVLNSHVWHGGTQNHNGRSRRILQTYFVHKAHHPQQYQPLLLTEETEQRLPVSALRLIDPVRFKG